MMAKFVYIPMANITLFAQAIGKQPKENVRKTINEAKTGGGKVI